MNRKEWNKVITEQCETAGTYSENLATIIDTLAGILEKRDAAEKTYQENGGKPVIEKYTERGGNINLVKNPALQVIIDLNTQALAFWRDLGLTPAGLKKVKTDAITKATTDGFEQLLAKIGQ